MSQLKIDFANRQFKRRVLIRQLPRVYMYAVPTGLVLLILFIVLAQIYAGRSEETFASAQEIENRIAHIKRNQQVQNSQPPASVKAINQAVRRLNFPWGEVLRGLESATPADVGILALMPDPDSGLITIRAETKTPQEMLAYVQQLDRQYLQRPNLIRHEVNKLDPNEPYRFEVVVPLGRTAP